MSASSDPKRGGIVAYKPLIHAPRCMVQQGDAEGPFASELPDDEVCVIFITHESDVKTRRIFNTVNRYAKQTSRGDNIITSEDDGYAIVSRRLLRDGAPLGARMYGKRQGRGPRRMEKQHAHGA